MRFFRPTAQESNYVIIAGSRSIGSLGSEVHQPAGLGLKAMWWSEEGGCS